MVTIRLVVQPDASIAVIVWPPVGVYDSAGPEIRQTMQRQHYLFTAQTIRDCLLRLRATNNTSFLCSQKRSVSGITYGALCIAMNEHWIEGNESKEVKFNKVRKNVEQLYAEFVELDSTSPLG